MKAFKTKMTPLEIAQNKAREIIKEINYPDAKFIESNNIEIEDHSIKLDEKTSIQICQDHSFILTTINDDGKTLSMTDYKTAIDLINAMK